MLRFYTGIGSRRTPAHACDEIRAFAQRLAAAGYIVRSGGADGADKAFEEGAGRNIEIWRPRPAPARTQWGYFTPPDDLVPAAMDILKVATSEIRAKADAAGLLSYIPEVQLPVFAWKPYTQELHLRNVFQVFGRDLATPSQFLVCWAEPVGEFVRGGTRTAHWTATRAGIPVYNLAVPASWDAFVEQLEKIEAAFPRN